MEMACARTRGESHAYARSRREDLRAEQLPGRVLIRLPSGAVGLARSCETEPPLEDINIRELDRRRAVDAGDLLDDAEQLVSLFGGEPLVEKIRE